MCVFELDYSERKRKVLLSYLPKLVSIASVLALKPLRFQSVRKILRGLRIRAKSNLLQKGRGSRANERCFTIVSLFSSSSFSPYSFLVRLIFEIRVYSRKTRVHALRVLAGKIAFRKSIFNPSLFLTRGHALVLARARVAHDEYPCSYARIRAQTGDELPPSHCLPSFPR